MASGTRPLASLNRKRHRSHIGMRYAKQQTFSIPKSSVGLICRRLAPKPSAAFLPVEYDTLLGGDFARRIEGAGIVDLRHLMIAEAENLPQDFIGMFAQQRRARHLGRAVR